MTIEEFKAKGYLSEEEFRAGKRELVWSLWTEYKETMKRTDAYMRIATESKTGYTLVVQTITSKEKEAISKRR